MKYLRIGVAIASALGLALSLSLAAPVAFQIVTSIQQAADHQAAARDAR